MWPSGRQVEKQTIYDLGKTHHILIQNNQWASLVVSGVYFYPLFLSAVMFYLPATVSLDPTNFGWRTSHHWISKQTPLKINGHTSPETGSLSTSVLKQINSVESKVAALESSSQMKIRRISDWLVELSKNCWTWDNVLFRQKGLLVERNEICEDCIIH